ncbi:uncharacterized protein LOC144713243 [Wolffia australiana]
MKASIKFREERKPLIRAKVHVSMLGLPFLAAATAGETKDLRLDVATAFFSGPSFRFSYRPNDSWNPFSVVVRTGIGAFGSPASSPLTMSAEFNLLGGTGSGPSFVIRIKPRAGDFFLKKSVRSVAITPPPPAAVCAEADPGDAGDPPGVRYLPENGLFSRNTPNGTSSLIPVVYAGRSAELGACSVLPLWNSTIARFHWGLRLPSDLRSSFSDELRSIGGQSLRKLPTLAMGKISIEHKYHGQEIAAPTPSEETVKQDLASLQAETALLRKAVEELRAAKPPPPPPARAEWRDKPAARSSSFSRNGGESGWKSDGRTAEPTKDDVSEELRKALIGATGGGA